MAEIVAQQQNDVKPARPAGAHDRSGPTPSGLLPHPVQRVGELHRAIGNQTVGRLLQRKLTINEPGDSYEQEADRVAEDVMRSDAQPQTPLPIGRAAFSPQPLQRSCSCGGTCADCQEEQALQRKEASGIAVAGAGRAAPPIVHDVLRSSGRPLDAQTRAFMEPRFGRNFANVRVHTDGRAAESARAVNARAYTVGNAIAFGAGAYTPDSKDGRQLLAHELTHVVQQSATGPGPKQVQRDVTDPLDIMEGYTDETIVELNIDVVSRRARMRSMGGRAYEGLLNSLSTSLPAGEYLIERSYGPDPLRTWNIFKPDGSKVLGGMMFDVDFPNIDFNNLGFHKRTHLNIGAQGLDKLGALQPINKTYDEVKDDSTYIDNFTSASYDAFRREIHLVFDNGKEIAVPLRSIDRSVANAPVDPEVQERVKRLAERNQITMPTISGGSPGAVASLDVRGEDVFFLNTEQKVIRPRELRAGVTPRLHEAIKDLDPDASDLLFQAAIAFMAGPPMPEGAEYLALIPLGVRSGMALKNAIAHALETKAAGRLSVEIHPSGESAGARPGEHEPVTGISDEAHGVLPSTPHDVTASGELTNAEVARATLEMQQKVQSPGGVRRVTDPKLIDEFDIEVEVGGHVERRRIADDTWCLFSKPRCGIDPGNATNQAAEKAMGNRYPDFKKVGDKERATAEELVKRLSAEVKAPIPPKVVEAPWIGRIRSKSGKARSVSTSEGWLRDESKFWKQFEKDYPEDYKLIGPGNTVTPELSNKWGWKGKYVGEKLIHHHVENGAYVVPLPESLHAGEAGSSIHAKVKVEN